MLNSYTYQELEELFSSWGEPKYRAKQVFEWISRGVNPCNMTNIPKSLREKLDTLPFGTVEIVKRLVSQKDGTVKYLFKLFDCTMREGVLKKYNTATRSVYRPKWVAIWAVPFAHRRSRAVCAIWKLVKCFSRCLR